MIDAKPVAMRDAFLADLLLAMKHDSDIFLLSADFGSPVVDKIKEECPEQFVNVGIAEQNLVNVATGLSIEGATVFCYAIAPFITMRCYEQIRVNLALLSCVRSLNVNLVGVGAGYSYVVSGPTHQCYEDLSIMRALPNVRIISVSDHLNAQSCVDYAIKHNGPKYLRFDAQILPSLGQESGVERGFRVLKKGSDITLVGTGYTSHTIVKIAIQLETDLQISCQIIDVCRLDSDVQLSRVISADRIVSLEEGFESRGGLDAFLRSKCPENKSILGIGVTPAYDFMLGSREILHERVGIGVKVAVKRIKEWFANS